MSDSARSRKPPPTATQRALGLLVRREHSRKELTRKLAARGVEAGEAEAAIDKLAEAGWQDDARFAQSLVRSRSQAGYGPAWLRAELGTHGLQEAVILAALDEAEVDWTQVATALVRRRFGACGPLGLEPRRKATDLLLRRGFGFDQVRAALDAAADDA